MPGTGKWFLYETRDFSPTAKRNRSPSNAIFCSPSPPRALDRQFNFYYEADVFGYLLPTVQDFETARDAQVAQLVEQRTENPRVGGSIPPLGTTFSLFFLDHSLCWLLSIHPILCPDIAFCHSESDQGVTAQSSGSSSMLCEFSTLWRDDLTKKFHFLFYDKSLNLLHNHTVTSYQVFSLKKPLVGLSTKSTSSTLHT